MGWMLAISPGFFSLSKRLCYEQEKTMSHQTLTTHGSGPNVTRAEPQAVLPGTFVEFFGSGFGNQYGDVAVRIGGREALVIE